MIVRFLILVTVVLGPLTASAEAPNGATTLWYKEPARVWTEALPVGNGRLGAMIFGGIAEEHLQLNEDTLWTGQPHDYSNPGAAKHLPEIRRLLEEGKRKDAEKLAMETFMSVPLRQEMYQPLGDLRIAIAGQENATDYRRELELTTAVAKVSYRVGETTFTRETFSSFPDQVIVQHFAASGPEKLNLSIALTSEQAAIVTKATPDGIRIEGKVSKGGLPFAAGVSVRTDGGKVIVEGEKLVVRDAKSVTLLVAGATAFRRFDDVSGDPVSKVDQQLAAVADRDFESLREAHKADYEKLYSRVTLDLGTSETASLPTDERLAIADKTNDPALATLLFNYGRYLLIASSRPGDQAANLQGIWNDKLVPPWGSKYTTNINAEMNYWPAEVANLSEMHEPFFDLIDGVRETGRRTAKVHYDAPGWVLHHNTDIWRGTAPINNSNHGIWPTGGAWLCLHLWEHYRYTGDKDFLAKRAYPVMKEASEFFVTTLQTDPKTGALISGPSNSPEHGGLVMGPTMDHQIIRGLFEWTAKAARELGRDEEFAAKLDTLRARIAPNKIGRHGQLQEWMEDVDDPTDVHRHVSHLWGVFPGEDITWQNPEMMKAARQSLVYRGDGGTGWSLGWKISLWARFLEGDHAHKIILNQLSLVRDGSPKLTKEGGGTYPNLFDAHPPFQIDGNFAATAGICEMLVQSHDGKITFLPALPKAWPKGSARGLRVRGGYEVGLDWADGNLTRAEIKSITGSGTVRLATGQSTSEIDVPKGGTVTLTPGLEAVKN
jgi:alpha-L-fucosidase 2